MSTILDKILEQKKLEIKLLRERDSEFIRSNSPRRPFSKSLKIQNGLGIISEVKKASPSKGIICTDFNPVNIARKYETGGAHAISVLTDENFFQGSIEYLIQVRAAVNIPLLRKDFIIDVLQVEQTAQIGADAMLLIAAALDDAQLLDLYQAADSLSIEPLIEVHNADELERVMKLDPKLIGINNRNLSSFVTSLDVTLSLIKLIPNDVCVVSESGIENGLQAMKLRDVGVKALLVGESLMRQADPGPLIQELMCRKGLHCECQD
jgi:indole-3-glycerol phosphate synthase